MSSGSIGVTKVEFVRWARSWVIRSPSCSTSRISRARSALSGQPLSISWSSRAARSEFPPACANRSKKTRSLGTSENARGRNYHARATVDLDGGERGYHLSQELAKAHLVTAARQAEQASAN